MIDLSTSEGKKQAIMGGVAVVLLIVAGWFIFSFFFPSKGDTPQPIKVEGTDKPKIPSRGQVNSPG
jgi:hypothetical protein